MKPRSPVPAENEIKLSPFSTHHKAELYQMGKQLERFERRGDFWRSCFICAACLFALAAALLFSAMG